MARLLHWKTTLAMASFYAAVAALLLAFVRDTTALLALLFVVFSLVLLAGNLFVRAREGRAQRSGAPGAGAVPGTLPAGGVQDVRTVESVRGMRVDGGVQRIRVEGSVQRSRAAGDRPEMRMTRDLPAGERGDGGGGP